MENCKVSSSTPSHGPVESKSKIPVPTAKKTSRIPVTLPVQKCGITKCEARASLIARVPNKKINIIQPIITKKHSPKFKEFDLVRGGTKPVVKKKGNAVQNKKPARGPRQTTLPENAFSVSKTKKEVPKTPMPDSVGKENAPPGRSTVQVNTSTHTKEPSLVEQQKGLNIKFEPSESSLNQILSNKELTHLELKEASNTQLKKFSDISEKMQKLSISKTSAMPQSQKKNFRPSMEIHSSLRKPQNIKNSMVNRRYTEAPVMKSSQDSDLFKIALENIRRMSAKKSPIVPRLKTNDRLFISPTYKKSPPDLDPFKIALQSIKRMSAKKYSSPSGPRLNTNDRTYISPSSKLPSPKLDPYENAIASIKQLRDLKSTTPTFSKLKTITKSFSPSSKPLDAFEEAKRRIEAWKARKAQRQNALQKSNPPKLEKPTIIVDSPPKVSPSIKPLEIEEPKSLYRPLKSLMQNSTSQGIKQRLTDISEHTEVDSTNSLTSNISDVLKHSTEISLDHRASIACSEKSQSLMRSLQNDLSDSRFSLYSVYLPLASSTSCTSTNSNSPFPICTPRPLTFKASTAPEFSPLFTAMSTKATVSHPAPICTSLVLQSMARVKVEEEFFSPVKMKLDFNTEETAGTNFSEHMKFELRSSIYTKNILTRAKLEESNADVECSTIMAVPPCPLLCSRALRNPLAKVLSEGDTMHFVPLTEEILAN